MTLDHAPTPPATAAPGSPAAADRLAALGGTLFTVCVLAGNGLTETVVGSDDSPAGTAADLAAQGASTAVRVGLGLELVGLLLAGGFAAAVAARGLGRAATRTAATVAAVAGGCLVAVKLASAAPYLAALSARDTLPDEVLHALVGTNEAAFVVTWLPAAVLVGATALVLHGTGVGGRLLRATGLVVAGAGLAAALVGSIDPSSAFPVPFLLGLVWIAVAGVRLARR
ncbi:hypothetical protein [Nocardioides caldifontis]|uniref:hypothetical protein n=1 Tax=Nocardioides caldifontis TaxID=2588938 RepID=UPI0013968C9C|nr:hypothetical protein [Nocardioides caldifontis]